MKAFINLSIRAKVLSVPSAMVVLLLALGGYAFYLLNSNEAQVRELNTGITQHVTTVLEFQVQAQKSLSKLFRLTSVAANESDADKLTKMSKAALADFDRFAGSLPAVKTAALAAGIPQDKVDGLDAAFAAYVKSAKSVIDMAESDASVALTFMTGAERKFGEVERIFEEVTESLNTARSGALGSIYAAMAEGRMIFVGVILAMAAAALAVSFLVSRLISRPIVDMTSALGRIAEKDYNVPVPALDQADEIGRMAEAVNVLKERSITADRLDAERQQASEAAKERASRLNELTHRFEQSVSGIVQGVSAGATEMRANAELLTQTAEQTNRQCSAVASASEQATGNAQTVSSAAEELTSSIVEIGRQVAHSAQITSKAVDEANQTNGTVKGLAEAAQKIGQIVNIINEIASQTNLLALNATIEAARAGDAGKGFAVVASEVKGLANQTARATEDIAAQISAMQQVTGEAVSAIGRIGSTIGEINQIAATIASAVEEQGAATQEIARNVQEAATRTQEVSSNIGGVTKAAAQTGDAAGTLLGAANGLAHQSAALRSEVDEFLAGVRAA